MHKVQITVYMIDKMYYELPILEVEEEKFNLEKIIGDFTRDLMQDSVKYFTFVNNCGVARALMTAHIVRIAAAEVY